MISQSNLNKLRALCKNVK